MPPTTTARRSPTARTISRAGASRAHACARFRTRGSTSCYGGRPRDRLDYFSCGRSTAPLFVFIHGGYWQRNEKEAFAFVAEGPLPHGIDVAAIGYTLAPEARLAEIVAEMPRGADVPRRACRRARLRRRAACSSAAGRPAAISPPRSAIASGIPRRPADQRHLRPRADRAQLSQREALAQRGRDRGSQPVAASGERQGAAAARGRRRRAARAAAAIAGLCRRGPRPRPAGAPHGARPAMHHFSILDELARPDGALVRELNALIAAPSPAVT